MLLSRPTRFPPLLSLSFAAVVVATFVHTGCSSSSGASAPTDFCSVTADAMKKCSNLPDSCSSFATDCSKLTALLNPTLLDAATKCVQASDCSGAGPLACLGSTLAQMTPTDDQKKLAQDYCTSCSAIGGDTCNAAFFGSDGSASALGYVLLPFGSAPVQGVDSECTKSSLGKTACQAKFSTCAEVELTKALANAVSTDTASCLLSAIKAGASSGGGDGGATQDGGKDAAAVCTDLPNTASFITLERVAGTEAPSVGGTVVDGTYTLVSLRAYTGAPAGTLTLKKTIRITGTKLESITEATDPQEIDVASGAFVASGTTFSRSLTCPSPPYSDIASYSSDGTTLTLTFSDHTVYTYGRQ